jgi:hypothetical protein
VLSSARKGINTSIERREERLALQAFTAETGFENYPWERM